MVKDTTTSMREKPVNGYNRLKKNVVLVHSRVAFLAFAYQGKKDIVFQFIIEYNSSLRDFYRPLGNNNNRSI
jgi:hypothetical protein